jgi:hypothetical protein
MTGSKTDHGREAEPVVLYDDPMAERAVLPIEAPDMTATELHASVLHRLVAVLTFLFGDRALVLGDIFVRVDETDQVSPDVLIVHGARPGRRTVYRVPPEPVPDLTIEILSPVNEKGKGRRQLLHKRELLGTIGVPLHIEIDPDRGLLTTWHNVDGTLVVDPPTDRYDGDALAGLAIRTSPGQVRLWLPDGREFIDPATEMSRADRLARALRDAGIDPASV